MNVNALRDIDNDAGFYAAVSSRDRNWPGALLYQSIDDGASYQFVTGFTSRATMGQCVNALGDFDSGNMVDESNAVTVRLMYGTLASVPYASLLAGGQAALIGDEILYYRDAVLNVDGSYTLTGLLRGRRGTEHSTSSHRIGERFVMLTAASIKRIAQVTADIGQTRRYKIVTSGTTLTSAPQQTFTNAGAALKPYSPAQVGGGRAADGALLMAWVPRGRLSGEWRDLVDVPLSESSEAYEVEIYSAGFAALLRTITGLTSPSTTYPAADQVSDFGSVQAAICVRVYQLSSIVGRGYAAQATI